MEEVVIGGDLSALTAAQRVTYYRQVCDSLGLNYYTKPFAYITLNGKLTLYATRDCTDQLRKIHSLGVSIISRERMEDVYVVTAKATLPNGRTDESIGAVSIGAMKGDALANGLMKAETKAKRRVTLSIVGLGWLDESELATVPGARPVNVTAEGVIVEGDTTQPTERAEAPAAEGAYSCNDMFEWLTDKHDMAEEPAKALAELYHYMGISRADGWVRGGKAVKTYNRDNDAFLDSVNQALSEAKPKAEAAAQSGK